jgi:hypothetical protein
LTAAAREIHYLLIAVGLMETLFGESWSLDGYDAALDRQLTVVGSAISEQLTAAWE